MKATTAPDYEQQQLVGNALRFLTQASSFAQCGINDPDSQLFACVHASMGVELLFKSRLAAEHWSLIFDTPELALKSRSESGDVPTVGAAKAIDRLLGFCDVDFEERDRRAIKSLLRVRNAAVHFSASIEDTQAQALVARSLHVSFDFIEMHLSQIASEFEDELDLLRTTAVRFDSFVVERLKRVSGKIRDGHAFECSVCRQNSMTFDSGVGKCHVCHNLAYAEDFVLFSDLFCPWCGEDAVRLIKYFTEMEEDGSGGQTYADVVCLQCGQPSVFAECPRCESLHEGEFLCEACTSWVNDQ